MGLDHIIRTVITDPLSNDALAKAKNSRKMSKLVANALHRYVRSKEGKFFLELISQSEPRRSRKGKKAPADAAKSQQITGSKDVATEEPQKTKRFTINDMLTIDHD